MVSYLVLCAHAQTRLPGTLTIPEQIANNKQPYYEALEDADRRSAGGSLDVSAIEQLLSECLARQLYEFYKTLGGPDADISEDTKAELDRVLQEAKVDGLIVREARPFLPRHQTGGVIGWVERHPTMAALIGVLIAALITAAATIFAGGG